LLRCCTLIPRDDLLQYVVDCWLLLLLTLTHACVAILPLLHCLALPVVRDIESWCYFAFVVDWCAHVLVLHFADCCLCLVLLCWWSMLRAWLIRCYRYVIHLRDCIYILLLWHRDALRNVTYVCVAMMLPIRVDIVVADVHTTSMLLHFVTLWWRTLLTMLTPYFVIVAWCYVLMLVRWHIYFDTRYLRLHWCYHALPRKPVVFCCCLLRYAHCCTLITHFAPQYARLVTLMIPLLLTLTHFTDVVPLRADDVVPRLRTLMRYIDGSDAIHTAMTLCRWLPTMLYQ